MPEAAADINTLAEPSSRSSGAVSVIDSFTAESRPGRVIGSRLEDGTIRRGVDKEGVIGIDSGALRIQPLLRPGWGRSGIAYGPYRRRNGLAFGAFLLNGHNISRTEPFPDDLRMRLWRWAVGSETEKPFKRLARLFRGRQRKLLLRRIIQWIRLGSGFFPVPTLDENLSVGWFLTEAPSNPLQQGNALTMHAIVPEGGELWARVGTASLPTLRGLQNIPMYFLVVLREKGAAYYAASLSEGFGLEASPSMRLLAIDSFSAEENLYAGIHQSVLGEIGFRVDSRVYQTQIADIPEFERWYGSAQGADRLTGEGTLHLSDAETGGNWTTAEGEFRRTDQGIRALGEGPHSALLPLDSPSGLLHLLIQVADAPVDGVGVIWRAQDDDNYWMFEAASRHCQLAIREKGVTHYFAASREHFLAPNAVNSLQVFDDGENIRVCLNGQLLYGSGLVDKRLNNAGGVGVRAMGSLEGVFLRSFEAHPRQVHLPPAFHFESEFIRRGQQIVVADDFEGPEADLAGHATKVGGHLWKKEIGQGTFRLTGQNAVKVQATAKTPCPGRTAYTIPWRNPDFADVQVNITPPGTNRGQGERGRSGLIFWQDPANYIIWNLWIHDTCCSVSSFFTVDGYEEIYDAVWTNVGKRIHWGVPYDFRVRCDGKRFLISINEETVLFRALSDVYPTWNRLLINRVGLVANWEWGNDTGSVFRKFLAKDLP